MPFQDRIIPLKYNSSAIPTKRYKYKTAKKYCIDSIRNPSIAQGTIIKRRGRKCGFLIFF